MKSLKSPTQIESLYGLEKAIISNGKIANVVSNSYGHIPNQLFFKKAEEMLIDAKLNYHKRTINKNDWSFITDFIIHDKSQFTVKNHKDLILPDTSVFTEKYILTDYTSCKLKLSFQSITAGTTLI